MTQTRILTYEGLEIFAQQLRGTYLGNTDFAAYRERTAEMLAQINAKILSLTGLSGTDFIGTFPSLDELKAALPAGQHSAWGLVGADLTSMKMHSTNDGGETWTEWETSYDFTDFTGIKASLAGMSLSEPMSETEWDDITEGGTTSARLEPKTIYMVYEDD